MAQQLSAAQTIEVKFFCRASGQVSVNIRHYRVTGTTGTGRTDLDMADFVSAGVADEYAAILNNAAEYFGLTLQIIRPTLFIRVSSVSGQQGGTGLGDILPPSTSSLAKIETDLGGRKGRGRIYMPFPSESDNVPPGAPAVAYLTNAFNLVTEILTPWTSSAAGGGSTATMIPIIYNRAAGTGLVVTGFRLRTEWAQQRRRSRLRGGDPNPF